MRLLIRVDGGYEIGLGNVYRTLGLLHQIELSYPTKRADVLFLTGYDAHTSELIERQGYHVVHIGRVSLEAEIATQKAWVRRWQPHCVIVDVPEAPNRPAEFFKSLRWKANTLLINLSDCNSGRHEADIVIEGDVYHYADTVDGMVGQRPRYLRGPKYWIVHPAFASARVAAESNSNRVGILISFGGSDPANLNHKIADIADSLSSYNLPVTLVVGRGVERKIVLPPGWDVWRDVSPEQMAKEMCRAQIGIFSGGLTMYEAACIGLPAVIIAQNVSQDAGAKAFAQLGVHIYLGKSEEVQPKQVVHACAELLWDCVGWQRRSELAMQLIDGLAPQRIVNAILEETGCVLN